MVGTKDKKGEIPKDKLQENFNTEYSKLKNKPRVKKDICYKLNIGNNTYKKLKDDYLANELESKGVKLIPLNFEKEYMKYCNGEINRKELCIKFDIGETLMYKWRKLLGLPIKHLKKEIPENFKEEYMKYYNNEITRKDLCNKFNIGETLMYAWRDTLNLPKDKQRMTEIPENFKEEYMKYYNNEITRKDLCNKFNINRDLMYVWRDRSNLPSADPKHGRLLKVPENFEKLYIAFWKGKIPRKKFIKELNASMPTICKWRDKMELPWVFNASKYSLGDPTIQDSFKAELIFKFSLFGYEFSFKVKKKEPLKSVDLSDEFPDEVEY